LNKIDTFEKFLAVNTPTIELSGFLINMVMTFIIAWLISVTYIKFGSSISNRKLFSRNLLIIAMITMLIITIVKTSLALSLGLVGALSIVRFRTPIKEPEELLYLFLSISVGLGLGAGQRVITLAGSLFILAVICLRRRNSANLDQSMILSVSGKRSQSCILNAIVEILGKHSAELNLHRFDETDTHFESDFFILFTDYAQFESTKTELRALDETIHIAYINNRYP